MRNRLTQSCDEHEGVLAGDGALASERMRAHVNAVRAVSADYIRGLTPVHATQKAVRRASN